MSRVTDVRDRRPDAAAIEALEDSVVFGPADRLVARVSRASGQSTVAAQVTAALAQWEAWPPSNRRTAVGVGLVAAVLVHLGMTWWHATPPGWMWLLLPAQAFALGLALLTVDRIRGRQVR